MLPPRTVDDMSAAQGAASNSELGPGNARTVKLGPMAACGLLVIYTLIYVLPLYATANTRPSPTLSRNDPSVIRARIRSVRSSTTLCLIITFIVLNCVGKGTVSTHLHAMGFWPLGLPEAASALGLTATLFSGPLYETLVLDGAWKHWISLRAFSDGWSSLVVWRNIVIGPVTEELLFRSAAVPLFLLAHMSLTQTIFLTPIIFGLAHIHHFYEFRITNPDTAVAAAMARSVLQFSYTTLFGAYATFLFLRTGSLIAVIVVHAFCNAMGLPRVWGLIEPYWLIDGDTSAHRRACIVWSAPYYVLLVTGAWLWWKGLVPWTQSNLALLDMRL